MATSTLTRSDARTQALEFAAAYPTPNVQRAVAYAHAGVITWQEAYDLFKRSLAAGLAEVSR